MTQLEETQKYYSRAKEMMPGGVSSPVRSMKAIGGTPLYIKSGKGTQFTDIDNNTYYDLCMSFGPLILGHADERVVNTVIEIASQGTSFGTCSPHEVELAEKMIDAHPSTEWVRFVNSGTEAVMSAIRLARGYTNREIIVKFDGCYHGHVDSMLVKAGSGLVTFGISSSLGIPKGTSKDTIVIEIGNKELLSNVFEKHGENIAAVIMEGIPANNGLLIQSKDYIRFLSEITKKHGALLIFDEVITGFRIGLGGAASYYGTEPDIVTFGKIIGGGLPVGAYGGQKHLMDFIAPLGSVYQAGTLSGNPLAMAVGNLTLSILKEDGVYKKLEKLGSQFASELEENFTDRSIPLTVRRVGSILWPILQNDISPITPDEIGSDAVNKYSEFHKNALQEGVYLPPSAFEVAFLSLAHNEKNIGEIVNRLSKAGDKL
ncbi:MAG: glutamate-1-semialdehyde 2,1-aminomutase [Candidatus Heimdallarchaeota archaeon]|nr:glutamate-1-semialdehyde 2,1-aminomutase [Candidatus Heimdallarchaeota archaeon]